MDVDAAAVKMAFGDQLRHARQAAGISQEELAFRSGLHRTYISSAERGQRNVSLVNLYRIAEALSVQAGDLLP